MEANYIQASNNVIISNDGKYLTKVDSSNTLNRKLYEDEVEYGVSFGDVSIKLQKDSCYTDAMLMEFSKDTDDGAIFIDIVISDTIGTFISDWY